MISSKESARELLGLDKVNQVDYVAISVAFTLAFTFALGARRRADGEAGTNACVSEGVAGAGVEGCAEGVPVSTSPGWRISARTWPCLITASRGARISCRVPETGAGTS